jgi:hypothetical protein
MSSTIHSGVDLDTRSVPKAGETLDAVASAFGIAAVTAILFNTVLAWIKDAYDPLNSFMAHIGGHHWTTHGILDLLVFFGVGFALMRRPVARDGARMAALLAGSVVVAGGGLALWFLLV